MTRAWRRRPRRARAGGRRSRCALARLDVRPMHHDEANQAVKFGALLERGEYRYDAHDHHGPDALLPDAAVRLAARPAHARRRSTKRRSAACPSRSAPRRSCCCRCSRPASAGRPSAASAMLHGALARDGLLLADVHPGSRCSPASRSRSSSPSDASRPVAACAWSDAGRRRRRPRRRDQGNLGHRAARRAGGRARSPGGRSDRDGRANALTDGRWRAAALASLAAAAAVAALFYSSFFTAPAGILEPFRGAGTYLDRGIDPASHVHPWHYYLGLLTYSSSGGLTWSEGLVLVLAVVGAATAWRRPDRSRPDARFWARYLACDVAIAAAIFSAHSLQDALEPAAVLRRRVRARRRRVRGARPA